AGKPLLVLLYRHFGHILFGLLFLTGNSAERLIVDEFGNSGVFSRQRILCIFGDSYGTGLEAKRIKQKESSGQGIADTRNELDYLSRLQTANDAGEYTQNTGFGTAGHQSRRRRLREQVAVVGAAVAFIVYIVEDRDLSLKLKDGPVHVRYVQHHTGIIDQ